MDMICRNTSHNIHRYMYIYVCAFLVMSVFISCEKNESRAVREIKEMMGREIVFPKHYTILHHENYFNGKRLLSQNAKMITYVDENQSCNECTLKALCRWHDVVREIGEADFVYIIIFCNEDKKKVREAIRQIGITFPIMCYDTPIFEKENRLDVLARNKTFLLNRENKIVLVGEPFGNEKLTQLYKKTIASLKKEYSHTRE